jgi:hypothetical protein
LEKQKEKEQSKKMRRGDLKWLGEWGFGWTWDPAEFGTAWVW